MRFAQTIALTLVAASAASAHTGTFLDRLHPSDLRVASYNVNWDSIFPDDDPNNSSLRCCNKTAEFRRLIAAIQPDIMCLQEINSARPAQNVADIFDSTLPLPDGQHWFSAIGYSNVIISRWPLSMVRALTTPPGERPQCMALVDLPNAAFPKDLYIMNEHFKCCSSPIDDTLRQRQADAIVNWLRDARTAGGFINLPAGTPLLVIGDLNIVGSLNPLNTVLCGDIADNAAFGPDSPPDWDATCAADAHPLHNLVGPDDYTWRDDASAFPPGRLDFAIYSDSILNIARKLLINTTSMSAADRAATGLLENDVVLTPPGGFDHLPMVIDFRFNSAPIPPDGDVSLNGLTNADDIAWFSSLVIAGPAADPQRIPHGDYNHNGLVDPADIPAFVTNLIAP